MLRSTGKTLFKITAATGLVYGAGVALATQNEAFNEIFTDKIPFGEESVDFVQSLFQNNKRDHNIQNFKDKFAKLEQTLVVPKASGIQSSKIDSVQSKEAEIAQKVSEKVEDAKKFIAEHIKLPHLDIQARDSQVEQVIHEFNSIISRLNDGLLTKDEKFEKVQQVIRDLDSSLVKLSSRSEAEFQQRLAEQVASKEVDILNRFVDDFNVSLQQKEEQHQRQLQAEIAKAKEALEAYYQNQAKLASVNTQNEFSKIIKESIETERNGKLSQLKELNTKLENLQNLALSINDHLSNAELKVKLQLSLNKLRFKLQSDKIQDLSKELNELSELAQESKNDVILAALKAVNSQAVSNGLLTQSQLITRFGLLAPELRSASLLPPYAGVLGHLSARLFASLLIRKEGHAEGKDIESLISRVQNNLINNRLDEAVEEVSQLKGWSRTLADDWIDESRKRLEVEFLVNLIDLESRTLY